MSNPEIPATEADAQDDLIGLDRLARALLRTLSRLPSGAMVAIHGAPGSGREEFMRRLAWLAGGDRAGLGGGRTSALYPEVVWFDAWTWSKQGNLFTGLVAEVSRVGNNRQAGDRARELVGIINRLRLDDGAFEMSASPFGQESPVIKLGQGFNQLVDLVRGNHSGRLLVFVDELDLLPPIRRWAMLDGLRLICRAGAQVVVVVGMGREAGMGAVKALEGEVDEMHARRVLDELFDLTLNVPQLDLRRTSALLRRHLGAAEQVVEAAFGAESVAGLSAAVAHRQLGSPRLIRRLANRVALLGDYAVEVRVHRELTESQWAWVIVSERWPEFRRFMIRGGRDRWIELREIAAWMARQTRRESGLPSSPLASQLKADPVLSEYLRLHAEAFASDTEGIYWLEGLLLAAGL